MSDDLETTDDEEESPILPPPASFRLLGKAIRSRVMGGIMLILPLTITFYILRWFYLLLRDLVIEPVTYLLKQSIGYASGASKFHWPTVEEWVVPLAAVMIVLLLLYLFGMFFQSRMHRALDLLLMKVPIFTQIYKMVSNVVSSIRQQDTSTKRFKRVVLVQFPHPGMRVPGFVTSSCRDDLTGKRILCVYVPTTPVPTSGYMLLVPEDEVTELKWNINDTMQAIISGGISVPRTVNYYPKAITGPENA